MEEIKTHHSALKELPRWFYRTMREFGRDAVRAFYHRDRNDKDIQGTYYLTLKQLQKFIDEKVIEQENLLLDNYLEDPIYLNDYKKVISFDPEANWIYIKDMTTEDFIAMNKSKKEE